MEAVDAIFHALEETGCERLAAAPSELMGRHDQPSVFCDFTSHEILAAERFLIRCGVEIVRRRPPDTTS
ncbi:MAG: hypothetical protein EA376_01300 [Phycisphaeraceae bacterium]|nr:MAG: hypothetical protein EA376_01300 [Phycisphaeraceae bacterium]